MIHSRGLILAFFLIAALTHSASAQSYEDFISTLTKADSANAEIRVDLKGETDFYVGRLLSFTELDLTMEISAGSITLTFENIESVKIVDPSNKEALWFSNHSITIQWWGIY